MEKSEPLGGAQAWQKVVRQLREKINPPICGLLLAQRGRGHLWVDMAGDLSHDIAGPLRAMLLIPLAHLTDLELQPNEIMVTLTSEGGGMRPNPQPTWPTTM
jgi:hypothetical protein